MLNALTLMCALSATECRGQNDAVRIADAIDAATDDDRLRAVLVVYTHHESHWMTDPPPLSWDAHDRVSCGMLQMHCSFVDRQPNLTVQARTWLRWVQRSPKGLAGVDSSRTRAIARVREAAGILETAGREVGVAERQALPRE